MAGNVIVRGPDGAEYRFPAGTSQAVIQRVMSRQYPQPGGTQRPMLGALVPPLGAPVGGYSNLPLGQPSPAPAGGSGGWQPPASDAVPPPGGQAYTDLPAGATVVGQQGAAFPPPPPGFSLVPPSTVAPPGFTLRPSTGGGDNIPLPPPGFTRTDELSPDQQAAIEAARQRSTGGGNTAAPWQNDPIVQPAGQTPWANDPPVNPQRPWEAAPIVQPAGGGQPSTPTGRAGTRLFEVQAPDGRRYQIEAPDMNAAQAALRDFLAGQGGNGGQQGGGYQPPTEGTIEPFRFTIDGQEVTINAPNFDAAVQEAQAIQQGIREGRPAPAEVWAQGGGVDLRRPPAISGEEWFRQTYGRDPVSADEAGTNDPEAFRRRFGFDPVGATDDGRPLGEDANALRAQMDPEGHAAYQAALQRGLPDYGGTDEWDPSRLIPITGPGQFLRRAANAASFGWTDELAGLLGGNTDQERQLLDAYAEANPFGAGVADLFGTAATAAFPVGQGARLASGAATATRRALAGSGIGAGLGAVGGAVGGAGYSNVDGWGPEAWAERGDAAWRAAIPTSVVGGLVPLAAPLMARSARGIIPDRAARELPTTEDMRTGAQARFDRAEAAGLTVTSGALSDFAAAMRTEARRLGLDDVAGAGGLTPDSARLLDLIERVASPEGLPPGLLPSLDLSDLNRIREWAGAAASNSLRPRDQTIAASIRDSFDDWLDELTPDQILAGDRDVATAALREARELWGRMRRTEVIEGIENRAQISVNTSANGSMTLDQALRREFGNLLKNDRAMARFSAEEQDAIRAMAGGDFRSNVARRIGALAPRGVLPSLLAAAGASTGNVALMAASAVGEVARRSSQGMTMRRLGELNQIVRTGQPAGPPRGVAGLSTLGQLGNLSATPQGQGPIPYVGAALGRLVSPQVTALIPGGYH